MKLKVFIAVMALFLAGMFEAQAQPLIPPEKDAPPETTSAQQTQPSPGQNQNTSTAPIPVFIVNAPGSTSPRPDDNAENSREKSQDRLAFWVAISTIAVGVFTAGLLVVAFLQWRWTRKTVESMEDTAERQLRAYVNTTNQDTDDLKSADSQGKITYTIRIKNAGQTPAYKLVAQAWYCNMEFPQSDFYKPPTIDHTLKSGRMSLGPGEPIDIHCVEDKRQLRSGAMGTRMFIEGRVEYTDAFGRPHYTNFCFLVERMGDVERTVPQLRGNDTDDDTSQPS